MIYALRERYETELRHLNRFLSPGMVVVDGGANCGIYTVVAAKLVGLSGLVFSFEPGAEAFSALEKNIRLNGLGNVRTCRAALFDKEGTAPLYHHQWGPNSFSLGLPDTSEAAFEEVSTCSLCHAVPSELTRRIGLIKLDVEGAEELVLRGAKAIIACSHPVVIFEMNSIAARRLGLNPLGAWKLLATLGYTFFHLTEGGDLCELKSPPTEHDFVNVVAIFGGLRT